jgi:hypothetical protein
VDVVELATGVVARGGDAFGPRTVTTFGFDHISVLIYDHFGSSDCRSFQKVRIVYDDVA